MFLGLIKYYFKRVFVFCIFAIVCSVSLIAQIKQDSAKLELKDSASVERMDGVDIKVSGSLIESKADRLVYNAAQDITAKAASASELLAKVPMVDVDIDGNVSIRGSQNLKVLINGRPSGMMAGNVADALKSLPAASIDKIEVITNPSVKYDAEGTAGIINIILKDVKIKGTTSNYTAGVGTRSANFSADVSHQNGKTGITGRFGGHFWRSWGDGRTTRTNKIGGLEYLLKQNNSVVNLGGGPRLSLSVDHQINKTSALSFTATGRTHFRNSNNDFTTQTGISTAPLNFLWMQAIDNLTTGMGLDLNVDYRKNFKKPNRELGISAQYTWNADNTDYNMHRFDSLNHEIRYESSRNIGLNKELTMQLDYTEPFTSKLSLETGAKGILRRVGSQYNFDSMNYSANQLASIDYRSNQFDYYQNVFGGYAQMGYLQSDKWSYKLGIRAEHTQFGGVLYRPKEDKYTGKSYFNLIPYFNANWNYNKTSFLRFTYTQRIQRPSLFFLNPYTNYSDPLNISTGNPKLTAEVSNNMELSWGNYGKKGGGGANVYYRAIDNAIETIRTVGADRVYRTTYGNVGVNHTLGMDVNANLKTDKYTLNFNGGLGLVDIRSSIDTGSIAGLHNRGITYNAGLRGTFNMKNRWQMELMGRFNAPTISMQGYAMSWFFHMVGFKKRFMNDKGGLGFGLDNPFSPKIDIITKMTGKDFTFTSVQRLNMWGIRVNFDYKFGAMAVDKPKTVKRKLQNDDLKKAEGEGGMQ